MKAKWKLFSVRRAVRLYRISPIAVHRMPYLTIYNKILLLKLLFTDFKFFTVGWYYSRNLCKKGDLYLPI